MPNAIEDALSRASAEQRERAQQAIEEARQNIKLVSVRQMGDISSTEADSVTRNAQIIEEAKRNIPFETMKDVNEVSPPLNTPSNRGYYNSTIIELHPNAQSQIETIEQGDGNNYLRENAVDRAMSRQSQEMGYEPQQQQALGR
jgi:predicted ribosome quality control (RQC) complex YloA/Tae2 family protein